MIGFMILSSINDISKKLQTDVISSLKNLFINQGPSGKSLVAKQHDSMKLFLVLCLAAVAVSSLEVDLVEVVIRAEEELKSSLMSQLIAGQRSSRFNRKKFTPE
jgi:hypothetical protein